ncbi:MAG: ComF family protein [Prevotella sp.]|nr:ComF family protein [Prevotella sp.]
MKTSFWTKLLDLIAPRTCANCGHRLSANEQVLCPVCYMHLPLTDYHLSPTDNPLARLFWGQFTVERAAALFFYEAQSEATTMIYDMKYHGQRDIAEGLGWIAARLFAKSDFFHDIDAIVPLPLTRKRQWQRGYNQSMEIARGISRVTGLPIYNHVVRRTAFKGSQTAKNAWQRRQNVEDVFRLTHADKISGKHLLLVDDIVTTGATMTACAKALCQADKVSISIFSLGYAKA